MPGFKVSLLYSYEYEVCASAKEIDSFFLFSSFISECEEMMTNDGCE